MTVNNKRKAKVKLTSDHLREIEAETANQQKAFDAFDDDKNLVLAGSAGTGKTFIALHMAFDEVLDANSFCDRVIIIRSIVPTRDIGYLPGNQDEKINIYQAPYKSLCAELFERKDAFDVLIDNKSLEFETTSFIRGLTFDNAVVIVDEMQNMTGHELDTIITRLGQSCRIIFAGDYNQSDFTRKHDRKGLNDFLTILRNSKNFETIEFGWLDILRSGTVRDYIMTKEMLKKDRKLEIDW